MNDERFLKDWLQETSAPGADPRSAADEVVTRLSATPQRRRWLPWPPARRPHRDELNPTDRRTRLMLSPVNAIVAGVLTLAVGGALYLVQPSISEPATVPSATVTLDAPVEFSGRFSPGDSLRMPIYTDGDGVVLERGAAWTPNIVEMSEPMLDGKLIYMQDTNRYRDGSGMSLSTITYRIENEDGAWQGTAIEPNQLGLTYTDNVVLVGEGAYAGLYAVMNQSNGDVKGVIFPAPPPEPSDLP